MFRRMILLPAAICYFLGIWSGLVIEKQGDLTDRLMTAVRAAPPNSRIHTSETSQHISSRGAVVAMNAMDGKSARPAEIKPVANGGKLRIICFGAHPDDCEIKAGGTAALWAAAGHHVKFVSLTNGDIGHWREAGGPLAQRRNAEV